MQGVPKLCSMPVCIKNSARFQPFIFVQRLDWHPMCLLQVGFSTSLGLLQRNGAEIDKFMGILRGSALYAPTFDKKLQRMLDRDYANPNFPTKVRHRSYCSIPNYCQTTASTTFSFSARCLDHSLAVIWETFSPACLRGWVITKQAEQEWALTCTIAGCCAACQG